ncbi:putative resolvase [Photobacterium aphoticum]|uniref:Putative resolvase n=1 Tax=Photobacterium aphoticum TaxID=754436 RepID=A0A090QYG5_9GAMM|nr:putative resolvase [Photobacterium aphoticum]
MKIYIYARVSTKKQADRGLSIDAQVENAINMARMSHQREPDGVFIDMGVSGSVELAERPEGGQLFNIADDGDVIIAVKLDRLFRDTVDGLLTANELVLDRGVQIITGDFGELDIHSPMRKFLFTQALAMAEFERAKAVERTQDVKRKQSRSGAYCGGYVPIGKEVIEQDGKRMLVDDEDAEHMLQIMTDLRQIRGLSYRAIEHAMLEEHGYTVSYKTVERQLKARGIE